MLLLGLEARQGLGPSDWLQGLGAQGPPILEVPEGFAGPRG